MPSLILKCKNAQIARYSENYIELYITDCEKKELLNQLVEKFTLKEILEIFEVDFVEQVIREIKNAAR